MWLIVVGALSITSPCLQAQEAAPPEPALAAEAPAPHPCRPWMSAPRGSSSPPRPAPCLGGAARWRSPRSSPLGGRGRDGSLEPGRLRHPPLEDLSGGVVVLAPKIQLPPPRPCPGRGRRVPGVRLGATGGVGYGVVTVGSANSAFTIGYGYGYGRVRTRKAPRASSSSAATRPSAAAGGSWSRVTSARAGWVSAILPLAACASVAGTGRWLGGVVPFYATGSGTPFPVLAVAWTF